MISLGSMMEVRHCSSYYLLPWSSVTDGEQSVRATERSASSGQCSVAYQLAGVKLGQAGPFAGTAAPRSVQRPLLKFAQFICVARPCMEN
jgi:hypothetical protein